MKEAELPGFDSQLKFGFKDDKRPRMTSNTDSYMAVIVIEIENTDFFGGMLVSY